MKPLFKKDINTILSTIDKALKQPMTIYIVGGSAGVLQGIQDNTRDLDIVINTHNDYTHMLATLHTIGWITIKNQPTTPTRLSNNTHYIDIFYKNVSTLMLTKSIQKRSVAYNKYTMISVFHLDTLSMLFSKIISLQSRNLKNKNNIQESIRKLVHTSHYSTVTLQHESIQQIICLLTNILESRISLRQKMTIIKKYIQLLYDPFNTKRLP